MKKKWYMAVRNILNEADDVKWELSMSWSMETPSWSDSWWYYDIGSAIQSLWPRWWWWWSEEAVMGGRPWAWWENTCRYLITINKHHLFSVVHSHSLSSCWWSTSWWTWNATQLSGRSYTSQLISYFSATLSLLISSWLYSQKCQKLWPKGNLNEKPIYSVASVWSEANPADIILYYYIYIIK